MDHRDTICAFSDKTLIEAAERLTPTAIAAVMRSASGNSATANLMLPDVLGVALENGEISINKRDVGTDDPRVSAIKKPGAIAARSDMPATPKAARPARKTASKPVTDKASKAKGEKRSPDAMAALMDKIATHVSENPGQGVEEMGRVFNSKTKELSRPIQKLLEANKITSKGQKRATRYWPAS